MSEEQINAGEEAGSPSINEHVESIRKGRQAKAAGKAKSGLFPVKLLRNYRPAGKFTIGGEDPTEEQQAKVLAGTSIEVPVEEARSVIDKGIATRNDPIDD
jgi:hypothetical protein